MVKTTDLNIRTLHRIAAVAAVLLMPVLDAAAIVSAIQTNGIVQTAGQEVRANSGSEPRSTGEQADVGGQSIAAKLSRAETAVLRFENTDNAPLTIIDVQVRLLRRDKSDSSAPGRPTDDYYVAPSITVTNKSTHRVTQFLFEFITGKGEPDYLHRIALPSIAPGSSQTSSEPTVKRFLAFPGEPGSWVVRIAGAVFSDGDYWGFEIPQETPRRTQEWFDSEKLPLLFKKAKEKEIQVENAQGSPLTVTRSYMKTLNVQEAAKKEVRSRRSQDFYLVSFTLNLLNNTGNRIVLIQMQAKKPGMLFDFHENVAVAGHGACELTLRSDVSTSEPDSLVIRITGVRFEGGEKWGRLTPKWQARFAGLGDTFQQPIALRVPRPNYTEKARKNKTEGEVYLRVLVGRDGKVRDVRVISGLPDGLTEEAIRCGYEIQFKPATKGGEPVEFWTQARVEFSIR